MRKRYKLCTLAKWIRLVIQTIVSFTLCFVSAVIFLWGMYLHQWEEFTPGALIGIAGVIVVFMTYREIA